MNIHYRDFSHLNLSNRNLDSANLTNNIFTGTDFTNTSLIGAGLSNSIVCGANFYAANLRGAALRYIDFDNVNLQYANLKFASVEGSNFQNAKIKEANFDNIKDFFPVNGYPLSCPEKGSFIGFKKAGDYIIELLIPEEAHRSSAFGRKCRCSKAKVLSITLFDGIVADTRTVKSDYDDNFYYTLGEWVEVDNFDFCRWRECSTGIHFYITREEALYS